MNALNKLPPVETVANKAEDFDSGFKVNNGNAHSTKTAEEKKNQQQVAKVCMVNHENAWVCYAWI